MTAATVRTKPRRYPRYLCAAGWCWSFSRFFSVYRCLFYVRQRKMYQQRENGTREREKQKKKCARCATCMYKHGVLAVIVWYIGTSEREREREARRKRPRPSWGILRSPSDEIILIVEPTQENRGHQQSGDRHACRDSYRWAELFSCMDMELSECERQTERQRITKKRQSIFIYPPLAVSVNLYGNVSAA